MFRGLHEGMGEDAMSDPKKLPEPDHFGMFLGIALAIATIFLLDSMSQYFEHTAQQEVRSSP